jgi:GNAT superfamily N-acetyltransferase
MAISEIKIRSGQIGETEVIQAIEMRSGQRFLKSAFPGVASDAPTSANLISDRIKCGDLLVATMDNNAPIAFAMFRPVGFSLYIEQVDVDPAFERRGIGAALLNHVLETARIKGYHALTLSTYKDVPWNAPYYLRIGFYFIPDDQLPEELLQIRREHVLRGLDESQRVFMQRFLQS